MKLVVPFHARRRHRRHRSHHRRAALRRCGASGWWSKTAGRRRQYRLQFVARSAPDGYTLYITAAGLAVNRYLFPSINYDPVADFAPVTLICFFPNLLVVPSASPLRSVGDLIAAAKASPGKINFGSPGHGSSPHMSGELFKHMAKVDLTHVPYRGASPAYTDLLAGRIDTMFSVMASGLPLVQSGQLRALGVTTGTRVQAAPEVPTIAEAGVPGYDTSSWFAFFVPAKTPPEIIKKMHTDRCRARRASDQGEARRTRRDRRRLHAGSAGRTFQSRDGRGAGDQGGQYQVSE